MGMKPSQDTNFLEYHLMFLLVTVASQLELVFVVVTSLVAFFQSLQLAVLATSDIYELLCDQNLKTKLPNLCPETI